MYKLCKTESSSCRQRLIERALLELMKSTRFEDITVSEICDSINVPRKAFYRYFDSKEGALHALLDHTLMEFQDFGGEYRKNEKRSLQRDLEQFFIFFRARRDFIDAFVRSELTGMLLQSSMSFSSSDMINTKKFLPEDTEWMRSNVFRFAICGLMTIMLDWYNRGFKESTADMSRIACRLLSQPLFPGLEKLS